MKIIKTAGLLVLLLFVIVFPMLFSNPAVTTIAVFTLMFAAATTGWSRRRRTTGWPSKFPAGDPT